MINDSRVQAPRVAVLALITAVATTLVGASTVLAGVAPPNDAIARPAVFESVPFEAEISVVGASSTGDPVSPCGLVGHSVWYRWAPTSSFTATAHTEGSAFDTLLAVYKAKSSGLKHVACDDDSGVGDTSLLTFDAVGGTTYYFQVGGAGTAEGALAFDVTGKPANDKFKKAIEIGSLGFVHEVDTTDGATLQSGEPTPSCAASFDRTIWFRYIPGSDRHLTADTFESEFDTFIAVWKGTSIDSLTEKACNDDSPGGSGESQVDWTAKAGKTYYIQVGGAIGDGSDMDFALARIP